MDSRTLMLCVFHDNGIHIRILANINRQFSSLSCFVLSLLLPRTTYYKFNSEKLCFEINSNPVDRTSVHRVQHFMYAC
jgi:hypothetical protein